MNESVPLQIVDNGSDHPDPAPKNRKKRSAATRAFFKRSAGTRAFLTLEELQEQVLPLSRRGIYGLRKRNIIPSVESGGGKVLFHRESVIAALVRLQRNGGAQ